MLKKSIITTCLILSSMTIAHAQTTMCFKQNHADLVTIENTRLDGGECASKKSAADMKKEGWTIGDIKMTPSASGTDFIYLFKKETNLENVSEEVLMDRLYKRIETEKVAKEEAAKEEVISANKKAGEKLFVSKCAICHGEKGELKAKGVSRPINSLDHIEFQTAIKDYNVGNNKDAGMAIVMRPYANMMDYNDIKNVYTYLKSINGDK
ncbi:MAG: cytochrome c [Arcobacteraceae bacterium]